MGNLDRIIKLEFLKDERFSYEDYESNSTFLKKCTKEYSFCADKEISGRYPAFIKKIIFLIELFKNMVVYKENILGFQFNLFRYILFLFLLVIYNFI